MPESGYSNIIQSFGNFTVKKNLTNFVLIPLRVFTGNLENYTFQQFHWPANFSIKVLEWAPLFLLGMLCQKELYRRKEFIFLVVFYVSVFVVNFFFGSHQVRYILSNFYLGLLFVCFFCYFLTNTGIKKLLLIFAIAFSIFQSEKKPIVALKYLTHPNQLVSFLNQYLYDYPQVYFLTQRNISANECGYGFQLLSMHYLKDFSELRSGRSLKLEV